MRDKPARHVAVPDVLDLPTTFTRGRRELVADHRHRLLTRLTGALIEEGNAGSLECLGEPGSAEGAVARP